MLDTSYQCAHQPGGHPVTAMGRRGAHGADLRPAIEVQPLARHGDELAVAADPDVVAKLDGSVQEWPWIRPADELQHLWNVMCTQRNRLRCVNAVYVLSDHLHDLELLESLPSVRHVGAGMDDPGVGSRRHDLDCAPP